MKVRMTRLLVIALVGAALASCSNRGSYSTAVNASAQPVAVNYIDTSDSRLRSVTILPGRQALLPPNREFSDLTLLEFRTADGGFVFNDFRKNGPQVRCSGDCRVIWLDNHKVKFFSRT
jgi:hypothetical protein